MKLTGNATHRKQPRQIQPLEKLSKWIKYSDRKFHLLHQPLKWPLLVLTSGKSIVLKITQLRSIKSGIEYGLESGINVVIELGIGPFLGCAANERKTAKIVDYG